MPQIVQVNMLGRFSIAPEGGMPPKELSFSSRSRRLWMLIAYFIMHRDRGIPPQELIDLFWPDGEADLVTLQNNVSRARAALRNLGFSSGLHLIICRDGLYRWAPQLETDLDADRFDELCNRTFACPEPQARLENALAAAALYEGDFLSEVALEPWCIHLNTYLHGRYLRLCRELVRMLSEGGRLEEALGICTKAIQLDPAAEDFSVEFIKLETQLGHPNKAMEHYNRIRNLYRETYNVSVSPEMEVAHTAAIRSQFGKEMEISEIRSFMTQGGPAAGAFLCDNTVFRGIVNLFIREQRRSAQPTQLAVMSLEAENRPPEEQAVDMKRLELSITATLRAGDPFTKVSFNQFMALLPGSTADGATSAMNRTISHLRRFYPKLASVFRYQLFDLKDLDDPTLYG